MRRIAMMLALGYICSACSVTRHIPEGSYFLQKVKIEEDKSAPRKERIPASDLEKYIRQTPNKRFLGTNFYVWLYEQADSSKHNRWNNWKRKIGQAPVLLDMSLTEKSAENLKVYMDSKGFFTSRATFEVDTTSRRKRATVTYRTHQGVPYRIDSVSYEFRDQFLEQIILPDTARTLIHPGAIFDITMLDRERERITAYLKERGYFNFSVNNIEYVADTLGGDQRVDLKVVVKQHLTGYNERGQAVMDNNMVYRIDRINIFPDYDPTVARTDTTLLERLDTVYYRGLNIIYEKRPNLRPSVLRQAVPLYPNYVYNSSQVNRTYTDLMSMGYFKSAKVTFVEQPRPVEVTDYVTYIGAETDTTQTRYTREGYLTCNILCTPTLKQSFKVELEGSTTSSFYGLTATVGYQNRNIFRGAEALDISFTAGYEFMKAPDAKKKRATEFGVTTGLTFPRFLIPWGTRRFRSVNQPKTKLEVSVNFQDRPYYRRTLSSAGLTYLWTNRSYSSFSLRPIDINVVDVSYLDPDFLKNTQNKYLINSYKTQFIAGLSFSYGYNNQRKHLGGNATVIRFNAETSGNLIDGLEHLFSKPKRGEDYYTIFGIRYSQYFRTDLSVSRKIMLGEKTALAGRLYGGVGLAYGNSQVIPFDRLFYAGGSNSMRGWTPRTLGPGSVPNPHSEFPTQLGDMKLEANLEFRFPIWGIVHGATFFDLGNIWYLKSNPGEYSDEAVFYFDNFYKQLGFNTGLGIRLDIKFAVLRLDWGIQLHNPNNPAGERWIHNFKWKNTALNFGVGYPF
ncbi:BamA/TamA family outer membrane protein [Alistipes sp.]|uniref:translocation and assembly module lipoprotein TamL n=1 Tax=Alistipes sp. TaxID=1872444 RepID=UPI003AF14BB6